MKENKIKQPHSAVLAVTYNCNSRCRMCNIWQKKSSNEIKPEDLLRLPKSLDDINITGGEPFLRDDLIAILDNVFSRCNPSKLVISTNGFLTNKIIRIAEGILKKNYADRIIIAISLDAIGKKHDEIRGIPNAYQIVNNTIQGLKKIGFNNIGIGFTFMQGNEDEYLKVYEFSKKNNLNFGSTITHNSSNYFSTQDNKKPDFTTVQNQVDGYIKDNINSFQKASLGKCYYMHGLANYAKTGKALVSCDAMFGSFFMDPYGNIYPCNILSDIAGNILKTDFNEIWQSAQAEKIRCKTKNCPNPCWMVCTAKPGIKKHWLKAGFWMLRKKLLNFKVK
jgi:radical SAM protein with 4Fe4S-binding SPASM domain